MDATAPDLIRAVIGFRQWRLHGDELWSLHADDRWGRGLLTARCLGEDAHDAPAPQNGCTCGFYAWYAPTPRTASAATSELVGGAVAQGAEHVGRERGLVARLGGDVDELERARGETVSQGHAPAGYSAIAAGGGRRPPRTGAPGRAFREQRACWGSCRAGACAVG